VRTGRGNPKCLLVFVIREYIFISVRGVAGSLLVPVVSTTAYDKKTGEKISDNGVIT
jgi:hypothetical protein